MAVFRVVKNIIKNKYIVATIVFLSFMVFGDKNNILEQYRLHKQYSKVKVEHDYYVLQIEKARNDYHDLFSNKKNLEKFAREKYLMKRDDEDVFVILKNQKKSQEVNPKSNSDETEDE